MIETQPASPDPPTTSEPIRVVVVDDHELVRNGLRALLDSQPDLCVVGEAASVAEGIRRVAFDEPDVVVLDVSLPDGSGIDACHEMRQVAPDCRVLMLTGFPDEAAYSEARKAGASGFLLKRADSAHLADAIRHVAEGDSVFEGPPSGPTTGPPASLDRLTSREQEILELIARGCTNREIAQHLYLAEKTIKNYVSTLLTKLGVDHRAGAAALYARYETQARMKRPPSAWNDLPGP